MRGSLPARKYHLTRLRGVFAVAIYDHRGRRQGRFTLGTRDRTEADRRLAKFIAEQERGQTKDITVEFLWERYREENADRHIAGRMEFSGRAILPLFGRLMPEEITSDLCRTYAANRRDQGRKDGTVWTELNHLQIVLHWAMREKLIERDVWIKRPPKPPPRDRRLTRAEAARLLKAADVPHVAVAIALMLGTAARIGAILSLTWDRVDFGTGLIRYGDPSDKTRRKGRATVPMTEDLRQRLEIARQAALTEHVVEYAVGPVKSIKRGFARAVAKAKLKNVTPHALRHSAASWMAEAGVPMTEIAAVLGHSDSRTTERIYAKFSPTYLRGAVSALRMSELPTGSAEPTEAPETGTIRRKRQTQGR